jgi:ABC-type transporter Mla maintaining outer membrane lipid asymmetry ATPase subunit MlaF
MIRTRSADAGGAPLALLYSFRAQPAQLRVALPLGGVHRVRMPDRASKARFVSAVLEARCEAPGEELELLGEKTLRLDPASRRRLRRRIAVLTPGLRLLSNLNAWENVALAAAYHGAPPLERIAQTTREVLEAFGAAPRSVLGRLPEELGSLERKLVAFARLLTAEPELAVFDSVDEGLSAGEISLSSRFEAEYRARQPAASLLHIDSEREHP